MTSTVSLSTALTQDLHGGVASVIVVADVVGGLGGSEPFHFSGSLGHEDQDAIAFATVQDPAV